MAAYAALVSVRHIVEQIQEHPFPPISLDEAQVESLTEKVSFLQEFLEGYSNVAGYTSEADALECRIADAAYAAEDVIESHIVDRILANGENVCSIEFNQALQKVIEDVDLIKSEVMGIKEKMGIQDQLQINSSGSPGSASTRQNFTVVGFDEEMYEVMDMLTGVQRNREIITIVGMGGIGKTTLARNVYKKQVVVQHFDIRVWVTISQEYRMREILAQLLQEGGEDFSQMEEHELGERLHKRLSGRRYLIIIDDIWDIELWDKLKLFFPDNNNGSRILLTTRLYMLIPEIFGSYCIELVFLDEEDSWDLFCKCVFGELDCPPELEDIGKQIAEGCRGLPLSIVVIGGLLAKSEKMRQNWEHVAENLNSIVNLEDNERCIQSLYLSYRNLPVYLKPCFLYLGVFREDDEIRASELINLWVAEGFLKPIDGKCLEEVAEEYLEELVGRNLIIVEEFNNFERVNICRIHDLLRDLCLREARKQKFVCVVDDHSLNIPQDLNRERRVCIHQHILREEYPPQFLDALESASCARSLIWESEGYNHLPLASSRLLRVVSVFNENNTDNADLEAILQRVNLRYLSVKVDLHYDVTSRLCIFPSSVSLLWNLQTLIVQNISFAPVPFEIWKMPQLRHVMFDAVVLPDPPSDLVDIVLKNLQTLSDIHDFKCSEEMVKRIPNISKLKLTYEEEQMESLHLLNNLSYLQKLKSLRLGVCSLSDPENMRNHLMQNLIFPLTLKKLTLDFTHLHWEDLTTKIGLLPLLEVLKLRNYALIGPEWETSEGQFCSLKVLLIEDCDLECWTTDDTHFPHLELLYLHFLENLREIPSSIGDIPTLKLIELEGCRKSVDSAKRIQEEQEELGNEDLQVRY